MPSGGWLGGHGLIAALLAFACFSWSPTLGLLPGSLIAGLGFQLRRSFRGSTGSKRRLHLALRRRGAGVLQAPRCGYQPGCSSVRSVHDAVHIRIWPIPEPRTPLLDGCMSRPCGPSQPGRADMALRPPGDRAAGPAVPFRPGRYELNRGWLFGGVYTSGSADPGFYDSGFSEVTPPHPVVPLSWGGWDPAAWEKIWIYRRHLDGSLLAGGRVFADFDGIMVAATAVLNGTPLGSHRGGYLPWSIELTGHLAEGDNVLALMVDSRCLPVPPHGAPRGSRAVDFLQPGGIYRDAAL